MNVLQLLVSCPDQPGIINEVSGFLYGAGANILHSDQHSSDSTSSAGSRTISRSLDPASLHHDGLYAPRR